MSETEADDALGRFLPTPSVALDRRHHVVAFVLRDPRSHANSQVAAGLSSGIRVPEHVVEVLGSDAELVAAAANEAVAFDGCDEGLEGDGTRVHWYWLVPTNCKPEPDCLAALLDGADRAGQAQVLVPKLVAAHDSNRLLGVGALWVPGVPCVERLEPGERDQGQHDVDQSVYSAGRQGLLVRADVWNRLGGPSAELGAWASVRDLCRRVWAGGGEVRFVASAVVAQASIGPYGASDPDEVRAIRTGQLRLELTQSPVMALPWRLMRAVVTTVFRSLGILLTREPEEAVAEWRGGWRVLAHPLQLLRLRRVVDKSSPSPRRALRPPQLRAAPGTVMRHELESLASWIRGQFHPTRISPNTWVGLMVGVGLMTASVIRDPGILFGSGTLRGGGLLPAGSSASVLAEYLASWQPARFGTPSAQPLYLPLLALAGAPLLGSVDLLLRILCGLAVPIAFASAWLNARRRLDPTTAMLLALTWALLPVSVAAAGSGRLSTLAVVVLGPPALASIWRALNSARAGEGGLRQIFAAGALVGVIAAFAPLTALLGVGSAFVWVIATAAAWAKRPALFILGSGAMFVALWAPHAFQYPWLVFTEMGRNDPFLIGTGPWALGLSPGGPSAVAWGGLGLIVATIFLRWRRENRVCSDWLLAWALTLIVISAWAPAVLSRLWPHAPTFWPGQTLLVAGGLLTVACARLHRHARTSVERSIWPGAVAMLAAAWWVAPSVIEVSGKSGLPPVVALDEKSSERPRSLVLARSSAGVRFAVSSGSATSLGASDALVAHRDTDFVEAVSALVSGTSGDLGIMLGGRGIRYVVFDGSADDELALRLDAAIGLRRLASGAQQTLWVVVGEPVRSSLVPRVGDRIVVPILTTPSTVDVVLHAAASTPLRLRLGESADRGWTARSAGGEIPLSRDPLGMLSATVESAGPLQVTHHSWWPALARGQLALIIGLAIVAVPKRRRVAIDSEA